MVLVSIRTLLVNLDVPFPKSEYFDFEMFLHFANFEKSNWFCLDGNALCL